MTEGLRTLAEVDYIVIGKSDVGSEGLLLGSLELPPPRTFTGEKSPIVAGMVPASKR